jgi:hypothetical protein
MGDKSPLPAGARRWGSALLLVVVVAGCGITEPYLFRADEFNRDSPTFNRPLAAGQPVSICYTSLATSPETVQQMADTQCAQFDQRAALLSTTVARCPLLTPVEAMFACVAPAEAPTAAPAPPPPGA